MLFLYFLELINNRYQNEQRNLSKTSQLLNINHQTLSKCSQYTNDLYQFNQLMNIAKIICFVCFVIMGGFGYLEYFINIVLGLNNILIGGFVFFLIWNIVQEQIPIFINLYYNNHYLKVKHKLPTGNKRQFLITSLINVLISSVLSSVISTIFIAIIDYFPKHWILILILIISLLSITFTIFLLYPWIIYPLINKTIPLEKNSLLKKEIFKLIKKSGLKFKQILIHQDQDTSPQLNAEAIGIGPSKKIILNQSMIDNCSSEQILAISAHEMGHHHKHLIKRFVLASVMICFLIPIYGFFIVNIQIDMLAGLNITQKNPISLALLLFLWGSILQPFIQSILNYFSRKHEYQADSYSIKLLSSQEMAKVLKHMYIEELNMPIAHPLYSFIHNSHPTLLERVMAIEKTITINFDNK